MIELIAPDAALREKLSKYSHGAITAEDIVSLLRDKTAEVVQVNGRLVTGLAWGNDVVSFFGFHGELHKEDLFELDEYAKDVAIREGIKAMQFLSPRNAWHKLLAPMGYKAVLYVYEKEF